MQTSESIGRSERRIYRAGQDRQPEGKLIHNIMHVRIDSSKVSFETVHIHLKLVTSIKSK